MHLLLSHSDWLFIGGVLAVLVHLCGLAAAVVAIFKTRTSQGAIAWAISLIAFPWIALPFYLLIGRNKFHGYVRARRTGDKQLAVIANEVRERVRNHPQLVFQHQREDLRVLEQLAVAPFTTGNFSKLLINGKSCFDSIFEGIERARSYILIQFYIVRDDALGRRLLETLVKKSKEGVKIYFLYDEIGSHSLPKHYILELISAGIQIHAFGAPKVNVNRFHLNFRNHRKIVVIDGEEAYVGGHNVGCEYLGENPKLSPWRDTHVHLAGPAVKKVQLTFLEDWYWATHEVPEWAWDFHACKLGDEAALAVPSGPADDLETCALLFCHLINIAKKRIWIASPYFIPNGAVIAALQMAALRGVDVRLLIPDEPDHILVYFAAFSYFAETIPQGIKIYKYDDGFLHSKVVLVDNEFSVVGTANFDNRSFRLNFEISVITLGERFAGEMEKMFVADFEKSRKIDMSDLEKRPIWFHLLVRIARLFAPIL